MSISSLQSQKYLVEVEVLSLLLSRYIDLRNSAKTKENQLLIEAEAIQLFEKLLALDFKLSELSLCAYPNTQEYFSTYGDFEILLNIAISKLKHLTDLFMQHFEINQTQMLGIIGKIKRVKQKKSALKLWSESNAKYTFVDSFTNFDYLNTNFISEIPLQVRSEEGVLTLPIKSEKVLNIKKISISTGSNGVPGNSDIDVSLNMSNLDNMFDLDLNSWFEYERLDSGPLNLILNIELEKEEIINNIFLLPVNLGLSLNCEIEDIKFNLGAKDTVSIKTLISSNLNKSFWEMKTFVENGWSCTFSPIKANNITISLKQHQSYKIKTALGVRERFAIGLKGCEVKRFSFAQTGAINSTGINIPANLYAGLPFVDVFPPSSELFNIHFDISFDNGNTWSNLGSLDTGLAKSFLLDGEETVFLWRLTLQRDEAAIKQATSFINQSETNLLVKNLVRSVSGSHSPYTIGLPAKPFKSKVLVLQNKICRRGNKSRKIALGVGSGTNISMSLPLDIISHGIASEDVHIYVNGQEYANAVDRTSLGAGEWAFSDDFTEIEFTDDLPVNSKVELLLDAERMTFVERPDGYYHQMELMFDPDKAAIKIHTLPAVAAKVTLTLPRDLKLINLGYKNILSDTIQWTSKNGITYTQVNDRTTALNTALSFYIDCPNGLLWLNSELNNDVVRFSFNHMSSINVADTDYEIVWSEDGITPYGIRIPVNNFFSLTQTDTVGLGLSKVVNVNTGIYGVRNINLNTQIKAKALSYDRIIQGSICVSDNLLNTNETPEEIVFIDGESEFHGLLPISNERTVAIEATGGIVTFALSARSLWYKELGVHFSNTYYFANEVNSLASVNSFGEYYIDNTGLVTLYLGSSSLPAGIEISYYYKNPDFDPANKFSVDYKKGILYSYKSLVSNETITYKVANYKIAYDVARIVQQSKYNKTLNSIEIFTDNFLPINNLVKIFWLESETVSDLSDMINYFSPIIPLLGFRFT